MKDDRDSESIADDDKLNVSELAEDRTQRAFDSAPAPRAQIHYTMSDTTGENVIDDGRGFGKAPNGQNASMHYEKLPPARIEEYPPRYITGAPEEADGKDENKPNTKQDDVRSTTNSIYTESTANGTKLSVAQRARIAAEQKTNSVNLNGSLSLSETQETPPASKTPVKRVIGGRSESPFSKIGKKLVTALDNSIIGVKTPDITPKASNSNTPMTLAQRQQIQRERQLRVLREKGLIKDDGEDSLRGGAGSAASRS